MRMKSFVCLLGAALLLATAGGAAAQEFRATVRGQVLDTSKGALPGATVTLTNISTNETATAVTNTEGSYTVPFLRPGSYTMTVELSGFQKYTRAGMRLEVSQTATINVELGVGGLTEEVSVTAESPLLETSNANRGTIIDSARIAELPLQSRSPMALAVLVAGVNYNAQAIYLRPFDNGALADWSMNGGQNRNNEFLLDGAPNNANQGGNNIAYVPPAAAVQEFKVSTNSYDAQYGRTAGGVINMSLKSGTNSFHGEVYDFMRRKAVAANSFLLNSRSAPKTDQYIDQYGFSVDGPIFKNKTFFLFVGEKYREGTPAPLNSTTPTQAMKTGDFSGLVDAQGRPIIIFDPATGRDVNGVWIREPFPGNRIPAERINPTARALMQYYPDPNYTTAGAAPWQNNLDYAEHFNKDLFWNWVGKVDHNFGVNDRAFFRWGENERNEIRNTTPIRTGPAQNGQLPLWRANRALVADWVHIFGAGSVFNLRGGYTYYLDWSYGEPAFGFDATEFWPASLVSQMPSQALGGLFPVVNVEDYVGLSRGSQPNRNRNYSIQPNVSLNRGAHNIRSGLDFRWTNLFHENYNNSGGNISFTRALHAPNPEQHERARGQRLRLVAARRAKQRQRGCQPHASLQVVLRGSVDPGRLARQQQADPEPRLPLGLQWRGFGRGQPAELRVRSDDRQSDFGARWYQVMGGITVRRRRRRSGQAVEVRQEQLPVPRRHGLLNQRQDRVARRLGQVLPQPDRSGVQCRVQSRRRRSSRRLDGNRTPTYALSNPWPTGIQEPPGSSLGPLTFLGRGPSFSNPDFIVPNVHQFSAGIQRELPCCISLEVTYAGSRSYDIEGNFGGYNEPSAAFQARATSHKAAAAPCAISW